MNGNAVAFINGFASYALVFVIFIAVIVGCAIIGTGIRKAKNSKSGKSEDNED